MEKEDKDSAPSPGYGNGPPWIFEGSALYQLHLVKSETARIFIPKELKLVEAFGYTLGGFFLAHYDYSPAGKFDELVVLSGLVWNPPTSCAWAARVLVNSNEACLHGRKEIGLPSHVATFTRRFETLSQLQEKSGRSFLDKIGMGTTFTKSKGYQEIDISEIKGESAIPICNINLPNFVAKQNRHHNNLGPMVQISLPSFSGHTDYNPHLLKYSCKIESRIRPVKLAMVSRTDIASTSNEESIRKCSFEEMEKKELNQSISVLLSKPILTLEFNSLKMQVEAPEIVTTHYSQVPGSLERT